MFSVGGMPRLLYAKTIVRFLPEEQHNVYGLRTFGVADTARYQTRRTNTVGRADSEGHRSACQENTSPSKD